MTDRQEKLEQNVLATALGKLNRSIEPYSTPIAIVVGALFVAGLGWAFLSTRSTEQRSDATLELLGAARGGDAEALGSVYATFPDTTAGAWALVYQGNEYLAQGIGALYTDRETAVDLLGDARNAFSKSLDGSGDKVLRSRAQLGLAMTSESLGEIDQAIEHYEKTISIGESDAMIARAESRIESLGSESTREFLTWFAEQDFAPKDPSVPPSLPGVNEIPEVPNFDFGLDLPGGGDSESVEMENELKLPGDEEESGESDPASSAPASESKTEIKLPTGPETQTPAAEPETAAAETAQPETTPEDSSGE